MTKLDLSKLLGFRLFMEGDMNGTPAIVAAKVGDKTTFFGVKTTD
ncbi:MAG: hypothetical protein AAFW69_05105 [Pseudomonadota bacterium]